MGPDYTRPDPGYPALGDAHVSHNLFIGNPREPQVFAQEAFLDFHAEPTGARVIVTDNVFDYFPIPGSRAGEGFYQAGSDLVNRNVIHFPNSPYWGGLLVSQNDYAVTTGIDPLALQLAVQPNSGAWAVVTGIWQILIAFDVRSLPRRFRGVTAAS